MFSYLVSASILLSVSQSFAVSTTWNRNGNGNWNTSSYWTPNTIPNAAGDEASFTNNITANRTVILTSSRTIGVLNIGDADATHSFTIADNGNNNALIFDNDGNGAQLNETGARQDTIGAHINLLDNLTINNSGSLVIESTISGDFGITKTGSGELLISSYFNSYTGGITINQGEVAIGHESALGTGNIKLNGGTIALLSTGLSFSLGSGDGQLQVTGGISGFSGSYALSFSDIVWGSTYFSPTELVLQSNFARLDDIIELSSNIDLGGANRVIRSDQQGGSTAGGNGSFIGNITGSGKLTKVGIGQHIFQGYNTYDGGTDINEGVLSFDHLEAMPATGTVTVKTGATLGVTVSSGVDPGYWTMGTNGAGSLGGLLSGLGGQTGSNVLFQGDVGLMLNVYDESTYSGTIGNAGATNLSLLINNREDGSLTLSGNNSYSGATYAIKGRLTVSSLANAGASSSIGSYAAAGPSGLLLGGQHGGSATLSYTGGTVTTNRGFTLLGTATIDVASTNVALTMGDFQIQQNDTLSITGGTGSSLVLGNTALDTNHLNILAEIPVQIGHMEVSGAARTISNYGSAPLTLGSMNLISNLSLQGNFAEITGSITGAGSLTKNGNPTVLTLSHSNT